MKILGRLVLLLPFLINISQAIVIEGIEPILRYDENYSENKALVESHYLTVYPEDMQYSILSLGQELRFEKAQSLLEEVLNSEEFKVKVLSYVRSSDGSRAYQKNYLWNNASELLTNEDVYNLIMKGDEKMIPDTLGEMNIFSKIRKCNWFNSKVSVWCRSVIGSTNPSSSEWITMNYKFYKNYKASQMVSNMVHEWLHLLGFLHGKENLREEVPYVVGAIAGEVAANILESRGEEN